MGINTLYRSSIYLQGQTSLLELVTMHVTYIVIVSFLLGWTLRTAQFTCQSAVGEYRDCTCGVQYRDVEERCCSVRTCLQPVVLTENMTCPFQCLNNGTYIAEDHRCQCTNGRYGLCCEKGNIFLMHAASHAT